MSEWFEKIENGGYGPLVHGESVVSGSYVVGQYVEESHPFPDGRRTVRLWREDIGRSSGVFRDSLRPVPASWLR